MDRLIRTLDRVTGRTFVTGSAVVQEHDRYFGHDTETFSPQEYGEYIATSAHVYVAVQMRARLLASLPLRLYKGTASDRTEVESGPLYDLLHKVNPYWTMGRLITMSELSLSLWGTCYWMLEKGRTSRPGTVPREIWWARPDRIKPIPDPDTYVSGFIYESDNSGQTIHFRPDEVIWLRYPNPIDQFSGLSPLAAARLSADMASAAMHSNRNIFANGTNMAGIITPGDKASGEFTGDQANTLADMLTHRFKGADNAHRLAVLRFDAKFQSVQMSPKDAEFINMMRMTLEDVARAYSIPLDLIGGQRTFENYESAQRAVWTQAIVPEAQFIQTELTEQLLPQFPGIADMIEFDTTDVQALKESEDAAWTRWQGQITTGARTINEFREEQGLSPVEWGDVWWAGANLLPVGNKAADVLPPTLQAKVVGDVAKEVEGEDDSLLIGPGEEDAEFAELEDEIAIAAERSTVAHGIEYGSPEHQRLWSGLMRRIEPHERRLHTAIVDLMNRQKQAYVSKIKRGILPALDDDPAEVRAGYSYVPQKTFYDKSRWNKQFRVELKPIIGQLASSAAQGAMDDLALNMDFDTTDPNFIKFLEGRSQRFAEAINDTTWRTLQASIAKDIRAGKTIDYIARHVGYTMGDRIKSSAQTIARTETIGALNGGSLLSWEQSGQVDTKQWIAALDARTRDSHVKAHGQTVPINEDF